MRFIALHMFRDNVRHSARHAARGGIDSPFRPQRPAGRPDLDAFTVIELVIVVGVLSMLLAIILPTIKTVRTAALRKQAMADATTLAQAAIRYKTEYGFWPGQLESKNESEGTVRLRSEFQTSDTWLSGIISRYENTDFTVTTTTGTEPIYIDDNSAYQSFRRAGDKSGNTFKANPLNPKGIRFLDLKNEDAANTVCFPDPWGREYILIMGLNPRSTFRHTVTVQDGSTPSYTVSVSNVIAFAFSFGPDGSSSTNYIYSAGVRR